jgi:pyridoxal phosphate enzyme (YggS family)
LGCRNTSATLYYHVSIGFGLFEGVTLSDTLIEGSESDPIRSRIADNLRRVQDRVAEAADRSGRSSDGVLLVTVSKTWPASVVQAAVDAGAHTLGENRVQEAQDKVPNISGSPAWHLVGHLQRNKAKLAVSLFDTIQSVDSVRLAKEIGRHATDADKEVSIQLQVNTSGEASKFGVEPDNLEALVAGVIDIEGLTVDGLMTIAAHSDDEGAVRRCFVILREWRERIALEVPSIRHLSMGMTGDFEAAIEEGATVVRVGTAIFGKRS